MTSHEVCWKRAGPAFSLAYPWDEGAAEGTAAAARPRLRPMRSASAAALAVRAAVRGAAPLLQQCRGRHRRAQLRQKDARLMPMRLILSE